MDNNKKRKAVKENLGRVLVVDDEPSVRNVLEKFLKHQGYTVKTAEDGLIAIDMLNAGHFDLVLTDLKMPNLDGRELIERMSRQFPEIPKIVLTGLGTNEDIIFALKAGAYDFLTKPIMDLAILQHSVERALDRKLLNDDRNRFTEQLKQINEVISLLNKVKDTRDIFKALNISLKKIISFNRLTLAMIEDDEDTVLTKLVISDKAVMIEDGDQFSIKNSILKESAEKKGVLIIGNIKEYLIEHSDHRNARILLEEGMLSALILPLIIDNKISGFLIFSSVEPDFFKNEHLSFLESMVGQISFSIQRGNLLSELEMYTKKLEEIVKKRTEEVIKTQKTTIFALSRLAETRDLDTGEHLVRMRKYSILIAQILKYSGNGNEISNTYLRDLYDSSILHDIGKVGIPDSILLKPGPLTPNEYDIIKTHTFIGYNSLRDASVDLGDDSFLNMAMDITLSHHEQWDGKGYPNALKGTEIPLSARIVAIGDVYDALTSKRPYKDAYPHEEAVKIIKEEHSRFDPDLLKIFIENEKEFNSIKIEFS